MAIIKCKMCGGDMELSADKTFGTCEYCGSTMTLPKVEDDQRAAAFNRGNHFRRIGEFDKALAVYERIVREDETDAEAHWCCALCRFGIEYVEDPATYEWLPTCHRASFDSFLEDVDYLAAVEHSDGITKRQYQKDAAKIAEVQKGILATSQNEKPFDVFICYKETDGNGERTRDSILAQEIYYQLTEQGRRVFFARITLEDKIGTQYEPYIFAALNSAKVMVVVGTSAENLSAVWVKNEWSRFLALMKKDRSKLLLPCYRDMDPYDLPEQLSVLQSYDMSKIGFIQDLTRGISKVLDADKRPDPAQVVQQTVVQQAASSNMNALLKRGTMALEDGEWAKADGFFEEVLNQDAECAAAYLGKLMAELQVRKQENLKDCRYPFEKKSNYQKVLRFADQSLCEELKGYIRHIEERNEQERLENLYADAAELKAQAKSEEDYKKAAEAFAEIPGYRDADNQKQECLELAESARKDAIYEHAMTAARSHVVEDLEDAIKQLQTISGWKDADKQIYECQQRIDKLNAEAEAERLEKARQAEIEAQEAAERARKIKKILKIAIPVVAACIAIIILINTVIIPNNQYKKAVALMNNRQYQEATAAFVELDGYKDSEQKIIECGTAILDERYDAAVALMNAGQYSEASSAFKVLGTHRDSEQKVADCTTAILDREYDEAVALMDAGKYEAAISAFEKLNGYKDSCDKRNECRTAIKDGQYANAQILEDNGKYYEAISIYAELGNHNDAKERALSLWEKVAVRNTIDAGNYHNIGLKSDGTVGASGDNHSGQCVVQDWSDIIAIDAGNYHSVGLKSDGTVVATGDYEDNRSNVYEWKDVVAIAAGSQTVGLMVNGTVVAVGSNEYGECEVSDWSNIIAIAAGSCDDSIIGKSSHTVGLKTDGTVVAVGNNRNGQCNVDDWSNIIAIAAGSYHTVGLKADGTVVATGHNSGGQCDVTDWIDIVAIAAGSYHTVGLKSDGTVVATGSSTYGQCSVYDWTEIIAIGSGGWHTIGLKSDGTVLAVGDDGRNQLNVSGLKDLRIPD